jgi:2-hydroxychromene-2-carboxylate isomerase
LSFRDRLVRSIGPRVVIGLSEVRWPGRLKAQLRRARGGRGEVELYIAADDPASAVALSQLAERVRDRRAQIVLYPVAERGMENDPAADIRRDYVAMDAARMARRNGIDLEQATVALREACAVGDAELAANAKRMRGKGMYDTPAAWVAGEWFFAHERVDSICERLDYLGWA